MSHLAITIAAGAAVLGNYFLDRKRVESRRFREATRTPPHHGPSGQSIADRLKSDPNCSLNR